MEVLEYLAPGKGISSNSWTVVCVCVWGCTGLILQHILFTIDNGSENLKNVETSLTVQWLRLCTYNAGDAGSIPGQGIKVPHAVQCSQKIQKERKKENGVMCWKARELVSLCLL